MISGLPAIPSPIGWGAPPLSGEPAQVRPRRRILHSRADRSKSADRTSIKRALLCTCQSRRLRSVRGDSESTATRSDPGASLLKQPPAFACRVNLVIEEFIFPEQTSIRMIVTQSVVCGSAWAPVTLPVFKTGGRPHRATVCSTHTHFRHHYAHNGRLNTSLPEGVYPLRRLAGIRAEASSGQKATPIEKSHASWAQFWNPERHMLPSGVKGGCRILM